MPRPNPYEQGSIRQIAEIFLLPIIKAKPPLKNLQDWLEDCFAIGDREIKRYTAKMGFKLPGRYYVAANKTIPGVGNRSIKPLQELWIRTDKTMPDRIDVEINRKKLGTQVFCLNREEYTKILRRLVEKPFKLRKRERYSWLREPR